MNDCSSRIIRAMEEFLWILAVGGNKEDVINELMKCGDTARPYLNVVNGGEPSNTISAAVSYYQYVKLARGELRIDGDYLVGIDGDLTKPDITYSLIVDNMTRALKAQDYVTAGFLADLAFIARSYILCVSNNGKGNCDWIKRAFNARVLILRRFSNY